MKALITIHEVKNELLKNPLFLEYLESSKDEWQDLYELIPNSFDEFFLLFQVQNKVKNLEIQALLFQISCLKKLFTEVKYHINFAISEYEKNKEDIENFPYLLQLLPLFVQFMTVLASEDELEINTIIENITALETPFLLNEYEAKELMHNKNHINHKAQQQFKNERKLIISTLKDILGNPPQEISVFQKEFEMCIQNYLGIIHFLVEQNEVKVEDFDQAVAKFDEIITQINTNEYLTIPKLINSMSVFLAIISDTNIDDFGEFSLLLESLTSKEMEPVTISQSATKKENKEPTKEANSIKIEEILLDQFSELMNELHVIQSSISRINEMMKTNDSADVFSLVQNTDKNFSRVLQEMSDLFISIRLQDLKTTFQRFKRFVRDFASENNKKINLVAEGAETKIDSLILRRLADPFMHMIRNSCDHGIEDMNTRVANGKAETGILKLSAYSKGNRIFFEIYDDGAGLDPEKLKSKAIEKKLYTKAQLEQFSDDEINHLIFHPGFSTSETITQVSGRGVGMDIVKQTILEMKGHIKLESEKQVFTKFTIDFPMTTSISKGVIISISGALFLIPLENVMQFVTIHKENIKYQVKPASVYIQNKPVALYSINEILYDETPEYMKERDRELLAVHIAFREVEFCIFADKIVRIESIAQKPMPQGVGNTRYFSGCSIQSDGSIIPILKIDEFIEA